MKNKFLNNFISPTSGRVLSTHRYALVGDRNGIATPSPILIDMQLEIMRLQIEVEGMVTPVPIGSPPAEEDSSIDDIRFTSRNNVDRINELEQRITASDNRINELEQKITAIEQQLNR